MSKLWNYTDSYMPLGTILMVTKSLPDGAVQNQSVLNLALC